MKMQPPLQQFATLLGLDKNVAPAELILERDICTIGRSDECDVVVSGNKTISRLHAKIEREGPRYMLRDAGSANGVFLNGRRIRAPHLLQDDDVIGLGSAAAVLRFNDPDPTDLVETLHYDERAMLFFLGRRQIDLTLHEFRLLHHLYQHAGDVCTRASCAEAIWGRDYDPGPDDDALDRTVSNLRRKLRQFDSSIKPGDIIKTRRGLGYELIL